MGLKRDFSWLLAGRTASIGVGVLTGALINRSLGAAGRGIYAEMQTWVALFAVVFGLSLEAGINHYANRERYGTDDGGRLTTSTLLTACCGFLGAAGLTGLVLFQPGRVSEETAALVLPLTALLVFTLLATNGTVLLQSLNRVRASALVIFAQTLISLAVITAGYGTGLIAIPFLVRYLILLQGAALVFVYLALRRNRIRPGPFSGEMAAGMIKVGAKIHVATIATFVYTKANQLIVFRYCGEAEAGLFAVALNLAFYAVVVPATLQTALYPRVIHYRDEFEVTVKSLRMTFYGWGALVLVIILLAKPILLVYGGSQFLPSVGAFRILMIGAWLLPMSSMVAPYCVKVGAFGLLSLSAVLLGVLSVAANLLLIPAFRGHGAAWATTFTCFTGFVLSLLLLRYVSGRSPLSFLKPTVS